MNPSTDTSSSITRRESLRTASLAALGILGTPALCSSLLHAQSSAAPLTNRASQPRDALQRLYAGNERFIAGRTTANRDLARIAEVAASQSPFAAFLGCADSRVPVEIIFDQGFGDLFVTRIAGNVADPAIIGSLEFGTEVLGAAVVFVLGHSRCGAVSATMSGAAVPGQISTLYQHIRRAAKESGGDIVVAVRRNVEIQAEILAESSPVLAKRIADGKLLIAGGVYDLSTGRVSPVPLPAR